MRFGILGSGFGLYGWMPAVASISGTEIITLERYRCTIRERTELSHYEKDIRFVESPDEVLFDCHCLIIARRPEDQVSVSNWALSKNWRGKMILEKPLAPSPPAAAELLQALDRAEIPLTAGFSLCETQWSRECAELIAARRADRVFIRWKFCAHHYRNNLHIWKRKVEHGGGALRFFAIHLVAWCAGMKPWKVVSCSRLDGSGEDPWCRFELTDDEGTLIEVKCDSNFDGDPFFSVVAEYAGTPVASWTIPDPFAGETAAGLSGQDGRVPSLRRILKRVSRDGWSMPMEYAAHVELWRQLESARLTHE